MATQDDPFREARIQDGVLRCPFQGEELPMILRHADVQKAAKDWETFSSDAPFRVPIPSEEDLRTMRQLPIETDPPEHAALRKIVEPFFKRTRNPEVIARVDSLIAELLAEALASDSVEIVRDFALPLQSRAFTYLLDVPESEADLWISWGVHVFHDSEGEPKGDELEAYLHARFDQAEAEPGEDFFSALTQAEYEGRRLTRDELMGFANLAFAGGRDTIIHSVSTILAHFAQHPEALAFLREDPNKRIATASEEFFRTTSPLTHIGRVCPVETDVQGVVVPPDGRVSLCWASANRDETVFEHPDEVKLDRRPNPHIAFGAGAHFCLGAAHARLLVKTLLQQLCAKVASIEILEATENIEDQARYRRANGYDRLVVAVKGR